MNRPLAHKRSGQRVTLQDLAAHAGVSRSTVSLVLRGSPLVADDTRERVKASIAALGYVYNRGAATLRSRRTYTVGLLVCDVTNPFFAELTAGVDAALDRQGYVAFLANTGESPERQRRFIERMREQHVDAIVICPADGMPRSFVDESSVWETPCVQVLRYLRGHDEDYAGPDYLMGADIATEHLIKRGHTRIAFIGGDTRHSATRERYAGYRQALARHGLDYEHILHTPLTRREGAAAVTALLDDEKPATAALCYNDVVAFGAMLGLQSRGITPGDGFAVVGFDDVDEAALTRPALTTVSTNAFQVGEEAARLALRRIGRRGEAHERVVLPPRLIVRQSCGRPGDEH